MTGFALGRNDDVGRLFPGWVMARAGDRPELAEPSQILRLALGVDNPPGVTTVQGEESDRAVAMYMTLLEQFLDELAGSVDG